MVIIGRHITLRSGADERVTRAQLLCFAAVAGAFSRYRFIQSRDTRNTPHSLFPGFHPLGEAGIGSVDEARDTVVGE